ncbi:Phenylalanine--tRNA ligase beta subunit [Armadillidium vulgare]|nr:Phenylalanine--tRNA ligase beta subunit [Armadillidium vulgare]
MPIVSINRDLLYQNLGKSYTDEEFDELCFQFGIEVDDIIDDPEKGITLKIEVGANRYDLLCLEGISRALNIFLGNVQIPNYQLVPPKLPKEYRIIVKPNTAKVRPYVVGAVLRNITFTQSVYNSFIDLQDKLHQNIARKRTLVAIGTHDLDTVDGPFTYDAQPPQKITFIPLNRSENIKADLLLEELSHDSHLREYVPIIKDKPFIQL